MIFSLCAGALDETWSLQRFLFIVYKCEYTELVKQLYSETYGKGPYKKRTNLEWTASRYAHILLRASVIVPVTPTFCGCLWRESLSG